MNSPVPARWVVLDIEGTLTPTAQVHEVLYAYARPRLGPWIDRHPDDPQVAEAVAQVRAEAGLDAAAGTDEVVAVLHAWMDADRKATAPTANAMRQPQSCICCWVSTCCSTSCSVSASSWPAVSVTYWKLE